MSAMVPGLLLDRRVVVALLIAAFLIAQVVLAVRVGFLDRNEGGARPDYCGSVHPSQSAACFR